MLLCAHPVSIENLATVEFRSNRLVAIAVGLIAAVMGAFQCFLAWAFPEAPGFLVVTGPATLLVALTSFTYRRHVRLDPRQAVDTTELLIFRSGTRYAIAEFSSVGLTSAGSSQPVAGVRITYYVDLLGRRRLRLPRASETIEEARRRGAQVAAYLNLPFDEEARVGFFDRRW